MDQLYAQILKGLWKSRFWMFFSHSFFMLLLFNTIVVDLENNSSVWWPEGCVFDKIYAWQDEIKVKNTKYLFWLNMQVILVMWSHVFEIDAEGEMDKSPGWSLLYEFLVRNLKELGLWFTLQCSKTESSEHYPTKEILYFFLKSQGKLKKNQL